MPTPVTFSFPTAAAAMQATTEESIPPLSPTSTFYIRTYERNRGATNQRLESRREFVVRLRTHFAMAGRSVEEDEIFGEGARLRADVPSAVTPTAAIEDQAVVATDLVDVNDGRP